MDGKMLTNSIPPTEDSQICDISNKDFNETVETDTLSQPPYFSRIIENFKDKWYFRLFKKKVENE